MRHISHTIILTLQSDNYRFYLNIEKNTKIGSINSSRLDYCQKALSLVNFAVKTTVKSKYTDIQAIKLKGS